MTNELEKIFFQTFGIEPKKLKFCDWAGKCPKKYEICNDDCKHWKVVKETYPQITDRILLELICVVSERRILPSCNVNGLKEYVLKELCTMIMSEEAKHQVRTLFEEG